MTGRLQSCNFPVICPSGTRGYNVNTAISAARDERSRQLATLLLPVPAWEIQLKRISTRCARLLLAAGLLLSGLGSANAVPSFASQTGQRCASCHITGFAELTSFGRQFKLRGYALGEAKLPLSAGAVASRTSLGNVGAGSGSGMDDEMTFSDNDSVILQRLSLYFAGGVAEGTGAFVNYNYDAPERRGMMEMLDLRTTTGTTLAGKELLLGLTLNNNPTVSDIYNSTPGFGFPHLSASAMSTINPNAQAQLNNGLMSSVAGVSAYGWWDNMLYAEVGAYRTADGLFFVVPLRGAARRTCGH